MTNLTYLEFWKVYTLSPFHFLFFFLGFVLITVLTGMFIVACKDPKHEMPDIPAHLFTLVILCLFGIFAGPVDFIQSRNNLNKVLATDYLVSVNQFKETTSLRTPPAILDSVELKGNVITVEAPTSSITIANKNVPTLVKILKSKNVSTLALH
jgi:hypothetical protein